MTGRTSGNRKKSQRRERERHSYMRKSGVVNHARFGGTYIEFVVQTRQLRVEVILVKFLSDAGQPRGTHRVKGDRRGKGTAAFGVMHLRVEDVRDACLILLDETPAATIQNFVERILTTTATVIQNAPISPVNALSSA